MSEANIDPGMDRDKDLGAVTGEPKARGKKRRKVSILTREKIYTVDYKDIALLRRFLNDRGKILPMRQSGNTAKQQRMVASAIRRARELALLPYVTADMNPGREPGYRRDRRDRGDRYEHRDQNAERADKLEAAAAVAATPAAPVAEAPAVEAAPAPEPVVEAPAAEAPVAEATEAAAE